MQALADVALDNRGGRRSFVRGYVYRDGGYRVRPPGAEGAGIMTAMVRANCFIVIPEAVARVEPGDAISVELLDAAAAEEPAAAPVSAGVAGGDDCCD